MSIVKITDYGLGTYEPTQSPLVLDTPTGRCYHANDHGGRLGGVTWTEDFARHGMGLTPCKQCFPHPPSRS